MYTNMLDLVFPHYLLYMCCKIIIMLSSFDNACFLDKNDNSLNVYT